MALITSQLLYKMAKRTLPKIIPLRELKNTVSIFWVRKKSDWTCFYY